MKVYFVSEFGDISAEQEGDDVVLITKDLTVSEKNMLNKILKMYSDADFSNIDNKKIVVKGAKLSKIHTEMKKELKKGKDTITALKLKNGNIELIDSLEDIADSSAEDIGDVIVVDKPRRGCPMPEITKKKELSASEIARIFLTGEQLRDFEMYRSFISIGNWSQKPYRITSRWSPDVNKFGQVFDLSTGTVICASCDDIPPSEEMLSMKFSIELMEREFLYSPDNRCDVL